MSRPVTPILSVVVPCMGRLHHLKESAPALLAQPEIEYILVDYSCPDRCGDYARLHWPQVKVVEIPGKELFNKCIALNAGIRAAAGRWVTCLDADNVVDPTFAREVLSRVGEDAMVAIRAENEGTAFMVCSEAVWARSGGFDERMRGWGHEDTAMRRRLLDLGLRLRLLPSDLIQIISHNNEDRVRFYAEKEPFRSATANRLLLAVFLEREYYHPWPDPVTFALPGPDFKDVWKAVQYADFVQRAREGPVRLYPRWHGDTRLDQTALAREIAAVLDTPRSLDLVTEGPLSRVVSLPLDRTWDFPYVPTRLRWRGFSQQGRRRLAYQLGGGAPPERGDTLTRELRRRFCRAGEVELIEVAPGLPVAECVRLLAECDCYVGVENGLTHLGYAVGVPVFLLSSDQDDPETRSEYRSRSPVLCANVPELTAKVRWLFDQSGE